MFKAQLIDSYSRDQRETEDDHLRHQVRNHDLIYQQVNDTAISIEGFVEDLVIELDDTRVKQDKSLQAQNANCKRIVLDADDNSDVGYIALDFDPAQLRVASISTCLCQAFERALYQKDIRLISLALQATGRGNEFRRIGLVYEEYDMGYSEDGDNSSGSGEDIDHDGSVGQDNTLQEELSIGATCESDQGSNLELNTHSHNSRSDEDCSTQEKLNTSENEVMDSTSSSITEVPRAGSVAAEGQIDEDLLGRCDYLPSGWREKRRRRTIVLA